MADSGRYYGLVSLPLQQPILSCNAQYGSEANMYLHPPEHRAKTVKPLNTQFQIKNARQLN
jgi:hypothetical protein